MLLFVIKYIVLPPCTNCIIHQLVNDVFLHSNLDNLRLCCKDGGTFNEEVIGCVLDVVSNTLAFTRNGIPVEAPLYLGPNYTSCNHDIYPTINIKPECDPSADMELPSLKIDINSGTKDFRYQHDVRKLLMEKPSVRSSPFLVHER